MKPSLLDQVRQNLKESKGRWPEIARGADIDYFTLVRIANGTSKAPRYRTVQALADYFTANPVSATTPT